jgi:hypothetical protein
MQCVVYVLRQRGDKLDPATVRARPVEGWLYFGQDTRKVYPSECARLFKSERDPLDLIEPMVTAVVRKIERGGVLISGAEEVRSGVINRQSWYCVPGWLDDLTSMGTIPGAYDPPAP